MGDLLYGIDSGVGSIVAPASCSSGSSPLPARAIEINMDSFDFLSMDSTSTTTTTNNNTSSSSTTTNNNAGPAPAEASASPSKQAAKGALCSVWFMWQESTTTTNPSTLIISFPFFLAYLFILFIFLIFLILSCAYNDKMVALILIHSFLSRMCLSVCVFVGLF